MLELYELRVFLIAAETENFSETGRILDISQPAVSTHIQTLEQRLNTRLFDRTGRNIRLNEIGEAFVPIVRNLLKEAQRAEEFIAVRQGKLMGQLTVGSSTAAGKYLLPRLMARFMDQYPNVQLSCQIGPRGQSLDRLCAGETDIALGSLRIPRPMIEYRHFSDDLIVMITPMDHPWATKDVLTINDLVERPIILREPSSGTAITINRELAQFDMSIDMLQTRLVLWNTESIVQAVIEGVGPGFVSQTSAANAIQQKAVVEIPVEGLRLVQRLYMARHTHHSGSDAQVAFWDFAFAPDNQDLRPVIS
jgi:DNA-binding transcriptional LysR family regulator